MSGNYEGEIPIEVFEEILKELPKGLFQVVMKDATGSRRRPREVSEASEVQRAYDGGLNFSSAEFKSEDGSVYLSPFSVRVKYNGSEPSWVGKLKEIKDLGRRLVINGDFVHEVPENPYAVASLRRRYSD